VKFVLPDISFLPPPQVKFLKKESRKVKYYTILFEPKLDGINNNYDPDHQYSE
jgi:hypothetical protein